MAHLDEEVGLSEHARELKKWDLQKREGGMRPDRVEPFPMMLYRAIEVQGRISLDDPRSCRRIVRSEGELREAINDGWAEDPGAARFRLEAAQEAVANAAAEKAYADRRMSERAQEEAAAHDQAHGLKHVPEGPKKHWKQRRKEADAAGVTSPTV